MSLDNMSATSRAGSGSHGSAAAQELSIPDLRAAIKGRVIAPGEPGYDESRTTFYGGFDRHPAVVVRAADANDVAHVVLLARETGMELAIRSGGHSSAGHSVSDGGIVLDLGDMRSLDIDPERHTAWAEAGLTTGEYTSAASAYGLATGFGDTGSVGIGGITLGGGFGYLARKYGLTIDDLLAAEIVTADGQILQVDAETYPDLFWAIRGGGGNFGVVTRFQYRLHDVDTIVGGMLLLPATPEVISGFVAAAEAAPDELSTIANVMVAPPFPFLPSEYHGQLIVMAMLVYAGEVEAGQRAIAPFRALTTPLADMVRSMHYPEIYPHEEGGYHPVGTARTLFVDSFDVQDAKLAIERLKQSTANMSVVQIRVLGGAMARVPDDATAFGYRQRRIMVNVATLYSPTDDASVHAAWVKDLSDALSKGSADAYVNFIGDEGAARVHDAYPQKTWDRLVAIKTRYDPTNLFHLNQNIPPSNGSAPL
ncbi:MAG TPA: FAD-binding oxidoreductase [Aggregatilinea sp.]|uniref:FAD-binding oxidoreductase n=1 Tax=Aggregatilinea sp. TaxID=2806333 RepID=UPI002B6BC0DF|nr:FAD-binding oxidoreductase [Aggregatilinea sp.]HML21178.1 FAD-binding oxidoreductase [Aggregatilinea sp.]